MMCTWRIFFKSSPSDPALVIMTTLIMEPSRLAGAVAASMSSGVLGDSSLFPDTMMYALLLLVLLIPVPTPPAPAPTSKFCPPIPPAPLSYRLNPISSRASAIGTAPPLMYSEYTSTMPPAHFTMLLQMLAILLLYLPIFSGAKILSIPGLYSNEIVPAIASTRSFMTLLNPSSPTKTSPGLLRASSTLHGNVIVSACNALRD